MLGLYIVVGFCMAFFSEDSAWRFSGWCVVVSTVVGWIFGVKAGVICFFVILVIVVIWGVVAIKRLKDKTK